ncbi:type I-U CRISPR-associated protein Csb2 [Streptomyces sp. DSM 44915]|uniref:Type I-U CRISPR-associated protein Csb2 n=1 Tax=Streptomyces chisholmiae TaxID=3075540 RepID=A0ABU2JVK5_9ACTN|nr:type I-U CRISPR-associated protein Csb2 [Streptomyces sp. DSM 44915]MDT0268579.1 type I-U CRISPR-associated protein Csb2 [Streptomyces sp. DSM 44915]
MITLAFHFPNRRYHATPWGRYLNEGAVELPPSPWRILRTLYAAWKTRHPELDTDTIHPLLHQLAAPPVYHLPPYRLAHVRHYHPDTHHRADHHSTDRAIDAFAILGADATLYLTWHTAALTTAQHKALELLCQAVPYLGRSESLTQARIHEGPPPADTHTPCALHLWNDDTQAASGTDTVQLLAPDGALDLAALTQRPVDIRADKRRYPPNTRLLPYTVPLPDPAPHRPARTTRARPLTTAVRLTLAERIRPPLTQALTLTDALRAACIKQLTTGHPDRLQQASVLAGKNADQTPMRGHQHTHFIPYSTNGRHIDDIVLWAPAGLSDEELHAIHETARTRTIGVPQDIPGPHNLHLRVTAYGPAEATLPRAWTTPAARWTTTTPFIPPRHRKKKQELHAYLTAEITRELAHRDLPEPTDITLTPGPWSRHTRHRRSKKETLATARTAYGIQLTFPHPITGPLTLGRHSHFGLGTFTPTP